MLPFILALVGGWFVGDGASEKKVYAEGGEVEMKETYDKGAEKVWEAAKTMLKAGDDKHRFADGGEVKAKSVKFNSMYDGIVDAYESISQPHLYFYVSEVFNGNSYAVIGEAEGFPATEAWDDWFSKKEDAMAIAKELAEDKLAHGGTVGQILKGSVSEKELNALVERLEKKDSLTEREKYSLAKAKHLLKNKYLTDQYYENFSLTGNGAKKKYNIFQSHSDSQLKEAAKKLFPAMSYEEHKHKAKKFSELSFLASEEYSKVLRTNFKKEFGRDIHFTDYKVSGIWTNDFSDATKDNLRSLLHKWSEYNSACDLHNSMLRKADKVKPCIYKDGGEVTPENSGKEVAQEIVEQLGGISKLKMMTGAYGFTYTSKEPYGVTFRIKNPKANYIKIYLNGMDLYDVEIGRVRGMNYKILYEQKNVYAEDLKRIVESTTGMRLSLFASGGEVQPFKFTFKTDDELRKAESTGYIEDYDIVRLDVKYDDYNVDYPCKTEEEYLAHLKSVPQKGGVIVKQYQDKMYFDIAEFEEHECEMCEEFKRGGEIYWNGVEQLLSFNKKDYNVNINLKNLQVDVNINKNGADSVNQYAISDIGVEWSQEHWGYLIEPKTKEELFDVLNVLKVPFNKKRVESALLTGVYESGGNVKYTADKDKYNTTWGRMGTKSENTKCVGSFDIHDISRGKWHDFYLYELGTFDNVFYKDVELKDGEKLYRYETDTIKGLYFPLIKVNVKKGLVYFLKEMDADEAVFETKGIKPKYISLNETQKMAAGGLTESESKREAELLAEKEKLKKEELDISIGSGKNAKKVWEKKMLKINDELNELLKKKYGWKREEGGLTNEEQELYYAVFQGHTLGLLFINRHGSKKLLILRASVLKGSPYNEMSGSLPISESEEKELRPATEKDFEDFRVSLPKDFEPNGIKKFADGGEIDSPRALGTSLKKYFKEKFNIPIDVRYIKTVRGLDSSYYEITVPYKSGYTFPNSVRKEILEISYGKPISEVGVLNVNDISYGNIRQDRISVYGAHWKEFLKKDNTETKKISATKKLDELNFADGGELNGWAIFRLFRGGKGFVTRLDGESFGTFDYRAKYSDDKVLKFTLDEAKALIKNNLSYGVKLGVVNAMGAKQLFKTMSSFEHDKIKFAKGGSVKFADKVKAISKSLKGKKVPRKYRKEYGAVYKDDAKEAAQRIAGSMVQKGYSKGGRIKDSDIEVGKKFTLKNDEVIEIKRLFKENANEDWVEYSRNGETKENTVKALRIFINNWKK